MAIQLQTETSFGEEEKALARQWNELLKLYAGEYVVLYGGRVVAHGPDDEQLAAQMFAELGDVPFYIAPIAREPVVHELPSPELP